MLSRSASKFPPMPLRCPHRLGLQPSPQLNTQMLVQWICYFSHPSAAPRLGDGFLRKLTKRRARSRNGYWPLYPA
jgi:hypothetical protein